MSSILEKIKKIDDLPTLPAVAMEALSLAHAPNVSITKLSEVIHKDPPLATKMLKMANSSFYKRGDKPVETIQRAITILGLAEIINITSSVSVLSTFTSKKGFIWEAFWDHCVATAIVARTMARKIKMETQGREFVGGLLHDIGKIVLDFAVRDDFNKALDLSITRDCPLYEAEQEVLGTTHMEVGAFLAQKWNLPEYLTDIIRWHHAPDKAQFKPMTALISIADLLAKAKQLSYGGDKLSFVLADQPGWKTLIENRYPMDELDLERITFEMDTLAETVRDYIKSVTE
jgi:putative nucleotidyltransferase with HDIG domain